MNQCYWQSEWTSVTDSRKVCLCAVQLLRQMLTSNRTGRFPHLFLPQCLHRHHMNKIYHDDGGPVGTPRWLQADSLDPHMTPPNRFYICLISSIRWRKTDMRVNSRALACCTGPTRILLLHNPPLDAEVVVVFLAGRWRPSHKGGCSSLLGFSKCFLQTCSLPPFSPGCRASGLCFHKQPLSTKTINDGEEQ